jgi:hypothetical protein
MIENKSISVLANKFPKYNNHKLKHEIGWEREFFINKQQIKGSYNL